MTRTRSMAAKHRIYCDQGRPRLSDEQWRQITQLWGQGLKRTAIGRRLNIPKSTIMRAVQFVQIDAQEKGRSGEAAIALYRAEKERRKPRILALIEQCKAAMRADDEAKIEQTGGAQAAARRRANAAHAARVRHANNRQRRSA